MAIEADVPIIPGVDHAVHGLEEVTKIEMCIRDRIKTIRVMLIPNNKQNTKLFRYANTCLLYTSYIKIMVTVFTRLISCSVTNIFASDTNDVIEEKIDISENIIDEVGAVSYTHLDVYKRQVHM